MLINVSNTVDYAKKTDVLPTILSTELGVSNNRFLHWTQLDQYLPLILLVFYFLSMEVSCFNTQ